ncbi:UPF0323 family lipoprotein [Arcobacter sp. 15-2]|uniref:UPF0323 family lipoprotein n=1 Tax=Arcobacter sp. 15-2 TaxID=3374109 RepID=UPI00399D3ABB
MKNKKYFLKKISNYAVVGGLGATLIASMTGCEDKNANGQYNQNSNTISNASQKQGAFVIVEKNPQGGYQIVDEFPSSKTTIVLRENGTERILSQAEVDQLVAQEAKKIDNGTSNLTNPQNAQMSGGGMGLGETILASAAGAMIGAYIGNKLFNNSNYQNQRRTSYKSPSTYSKSVNSFNKAKSSSSSKATSSTKKSGFFGSSRTSGSRSSFGG